MFQPPNGPRLQGSQGPTKGRGDPPESQRGAAALQMVHGSSRPESRVPPPAGGGGRKRDPAGGTLFPIAPRPQAWAGGIREAIT